MARWRGGALIQLCLREWTVGLGELVEGGGLSELQPVCRVLAPLIASQLPATKSFHLLTAQNPQEHSDRGDTCHLACLPQIYNVRLGRQFYVLGSGFAVRYPRLDLWCCIDPQSSTKKNLLRPELGVSVALEHHQPVIHMPPHTQQEIKKNKSN